MSRKRKSSPNLINRVRDLARYIIDIHKGFDNIDSKDLKSHIKILAQNAKNLLNITDRKTKSYVNRTGKNEAGNRRSSQQ